MYIISELLGSIAIPETPIWGKLSANGVQSIPLFVDFQIPPAGAPTYMMFGLLGSKAIAFTLPCPAVFVEVLSTTAGPILDQLLAGLWIVLFLVPSKVFFSRHASHKIEGGAIDPSSIK